MFQLRYSSSRVSAFPFFILLRLFVFFRSLYIDKMTRFQCWPETLAITFTAIIIWNEVFMSKQQVDTQYDNRSLSVTNTNAGSDSI